MLVVAAASFLLRLKVLLNVFRNTLLFRNCTNITRSMNSLAAISITAFIAIGAEIDAKGNNFMVDVLGILLLELEIL